MLSAFLIAELLLAEHDVTGTIHMKAFMIRRALRIWPLYYVALFIGFLLALHHHHSSVQLFFIGSCAVFLGNWSYLVHAIPWENPFGPLWSISVEEQFYLLFPAAMKALKSRYVGLLGAGIMIASLVYLSTEGASKFQFDNAWYNSGSQALFFGAGIAVAAWLHNRRYALHNGYRAALLLLSAIICYITPLVFESEFTKSATTGLRLSCEYACIALACISLMFAVYRCAWTFPRWILTLGKISYGLYVFHTFSMFTFAIVFHKTHINDYILRGSSIVMTIALAMLSYTYLERPFLRLKHRFSFLESRPD